MKIIDFIVNPREIRERLEMNQDEFWTRIGVTQSSGSRYESGRSMPSPVRELLRLVHIEQLDLSRVRREHLDIIDHMRIHHPHLYQSLQRAVRAKRKKPEEVRR